MERPRAADDFAAHGRAGPLVTVYDLIERNAKHNTSEYGS